MPSTRRIAATTRPAAELGTLAIARPQQGSRAALSAVVADLVRLDAGLVALEGEMRTAIDRVPEAYRESARNLVHYVALRQHDLRALQKGLAELGLSSLGRCEGCVRSSTLAVSRRAHESLAFLGDENAQRALEGRLQETGGAAIAWEVAQETLHRHAQEVFGPPPEGCRIAIMVTAPSAAEADRAWMTKLLRAGMNVLRINCAHEGPDEWRRMIEVLADAREATGIACQVHMDLAGPKIRTGIIDGAQHIATWKPVKDSVGKVLLPARVMIGRFSALPHEGEGPALRISDDDFNALRVHDEVRFRDARGKRRRLEVHAIDENVIVAHAQRRAYLQGRVRARLVREGTPVAAVFLDVVAGEGAAIDVRSGDTLLLTARDTKGRPPVRDEEGRVTKPGIVACTLPLALRGLEVGHRVLFDDGCIGGAVQTMDGGRGDYLLKITHTKKETAHLRAEKGINLPDTTIAVSALTGEDLRALAFVAKHADAVGLSFVRHAEDVRRLHEELARLGDPPLGVVLKIETKAAFENLPRLLLEGLQRPPLAVMIARGDLAIEVGFERLSEVQEEILWLCEASHVPVIWATQVLDSLARTGVPSRAEVTDAANGVSAECVMLNKGPFVDEAVRTLADILRRMERHRDKKRSLFRKLSVSTFRAS